MINNTGQWVQYVLNGTQRTFTYPFQILFSNELVVTVTSQETNIETLLTKGVDYTVTGAGSKTGGTIVLTDPGLYKYTLTLYRRTDLLQQMGLTNGGGMDANALEAAFDKIYLILQDFDRRIKNTLRLKKTSLVNGLEMQDAIAHDATIVVNPSGDGLLMGMTISEIIIAAVYQAKLGIPPDINSLSDLSPNLGIITAGKIQNSNDSTYFDLDRNELVLGDELQYIDKVLTLAGYFNIISATGYEKIQDRPTSLNGINVTEGIRLASVELGADKTENNPQSVTWLTDAGLLITANDLDDVPNGNLYGRVNKTAISGGKIVLTEEGVYGTLPTALSDAKCTDPNADNTASNPQSKNWLTDADSLIGSDNLINGANLCYNSGFTAAQAGWSFLWTNLDVTNITSGVDSTVPYTLKYGHTFWVYQNDIQNDESKSYQIGSEYIHVEPSKYFCLSAYTGAHRCKVQVLISFYDLDNTFLGNGTLINADDTNDAEKLGGEALSDYKRIFVISECLYPTVAFAKIVLTKFDTKAGNTDSWMFATDIMFSEVTEKQSIPVSYQPRGDITAGATSFDTERVNGLESTTIIEGGKIGTGLVVTDSLLAGSVDADSVGANQIVSQSANIKDLVIQTIHIADHSITRTISATGGSFSFHDTDWLTVLTIPNFQADSGQVLILYSATFGVGDSLGEIQFYRDSTLLRQCTWQTGPFAFSLIDAPGTISASYTVKARQTYDTTGDVDNQSLVLFTTKK